MGISEGCLSLVCSLVGGVSSRILSGIDGVISDGVRVKRVVAFTCQLLALVEVDRGGTSPLHVWRRSRLMLGHLLVDSVDTEALLMHRYSKNHDFQVKIVGARGDLHAQTISVWMV